MDKHVIASEKAPAALGPYSAGIATGSIAFLSGQLGLDPATGELAKGVTAQAAQALDNIEALLAAASPSPIPRAAPCRWRRFPRAPSSRSSASSRCSHTPSSRAPRLAAAAAHRVAGVA